MLNRLNFTIGVMCGQKCVSMLNTETVHSVSKIRVGYYTEMPNSNIIIIIIIIVIIITQCICSAPITC